jgi:hypothetical protein
VEADKLGKGEEEKKEDKRCTCYTNKALQHTSTDATRSNFYMTREEGRREDVAEMTPSSNSSSQPSSFAAMHLQQNTSLFVEFVYSPQVSRKRREMWRRGRHSTSSLSVSLTVSRAVFISHRRSLCVVYFATDLC